MNAIAVAFGAYLLGSVSFAVIASRLFRLPDPRTYGSKNPGATNVLRSGRKAAALLTLIGDAGKGWLAVFLARHYGEGGELAVALALFSVVVGHMWPVFHRWQGGKGVSTAGGGLLAVHAWLGLGTIGTWVVIAVFFRMSSLAALVAAVFAPLFAGVLFGMGALTWSILGVSALLILRHRANIANLLAGTEGHIGSAKTGSATDSPPDR